MTNATETEFFWYASTDEERYTIGPCDTRDEVIQSATSDEFGYNYDEANPMMKFHIIEASKPAFNLADYFDVGDWFEGLENGAMYDLGDPDGDGILSAVTGTQGDDLQTRVRETIKKWQEDHAIRFDVWTFSTVRNGEWLEIPMKEAV